MRTISCSMMTLALALALGGACRKVPVRDVYCDGTPRWPCSDPAFPQCDVARNLCVAASDGGGGGDLGGDLGGGGCSGAADCPDDRPVCASRQCRACAGSADDAACAERAAATPRCFAASGRCADCAAAGAESSDCAASTPVCGDGGSCRACAAHAECASRLCGIDGACAAPATVAYADNRGGTCSGAHAATLADPACDLSAALAVHPTVRVLGSVTAYPYLSISSGDVRIVGPDTAPTARLTGDLTNPAVAISGLATHVVLDRLEVTGGGAGIDGIACGSATLGATLTITRTFVHGVGGAAVNASKCTLIIDRDQIGPLNAGGGLQLTNSPYTITNSFIVGNVGSGPAVLFNSGNTAVAPGFAHNTIANNTAGGIQCNATTTITSSIVTGNTPMDTNGSCTLTGSTTMAPDFVSASDLHLAGRTAANLACCIDRVASSPVDHDFDGRARPVGPAWDVGAHELP